MFAILGSFRINFPDKMRNLSSYGALQGTWTGRMSITVISNGKDRACAPLELPKKMRSIVGDTIIIFFDLQSIDSVTFFIYNVFVVTKNADANFNISVSLSIRKYKVEIMQ